MLAERMNARAIALGLEALRKVDRYRITKRGEQYTGWSALPPATPMGAAKMTADDALEFFAPPLTGTLARTTTSRSRSTGPIERRRSGCTRTQAGRPRTSRSCKKLSECSNRRRHEGLSNPEHADWLNASVTSISSLLQTVSMPKERRPRHFTEEPLRSSSRTERSNRPSH
jgi:hypothetical protein